MSYAVVVLKLTSEHFKPCLVNALMMIKYRRNQTKVAETNWLFQLRTTKYVSQISNIVKMDP